MAASLCYRQLTMELTKQKIHVWCCPIKIVITNQLHYNIDLYQLKLQQEVPVAYILFYQQFIISLAW